MQTPRPRRALVAAVATAAALTPAVSGCGKAPDVGNSAAAKAQSAADFGGMDELVRQAREEGQLNVYALAPTWANYGEMIKRFEQKYGIEVNNENPGGSSQLALSAAEKRIGQNRAVDALDLGTAFMQSASLKELLTPYKVRGWDGIPARQKERDGSYANNYGGYVSIGCDASAVRTCPTTFADLLKPEYRHKVALNGNPNDSSSAFAAVLAAAQANGGSFDDPQAGIDFFAKLKKSGNYVPVESSPATIQKGETPISIDWDYLNLGYSDTLKSKGVDWKVAVPEDGQYSEYYNQAVNRYAPHPAAARLWLEFVYSDEGQNIWLRGYSRPARLARMERDGTADADAAKRLPTVRGEPRFPTQKQQNAAKKAIADGWGQAVG